MEFERVPGRQAPSAPQTTSVTSSSTDIDFVPPSTLASRHDINLQDANLVARGNKSTGVSTSATTVSDGALIVRWSTLLQREEALKSAETSFQRSVAAWETQRRLWEADFEERLEILEAREAQLTRVCEAHRP